jgi:N utilization substance protein B
MGMAIGKRKSRELAMQILFAWDVRGESEAAMAEQIARDGGEEPNVRERAIAMARGAWDARAQTDEQVARLAPQWPTRRQAGVDRSLLRLAVWELTCGLTPPKVVLDEAIEVAKSFSTENSPAFINGVLDAVLKELQKIGTYAAEREGEPEEKESTNTLPDVAEPGVGSAESTAPDITATPNTTTS